MITNLHSVSEMESFIEKHPLAVIQVSRQNCSVCHAVAPRMEDLLSQYQDVVFGMVDADEVPDIAGALSIFTVPVDIIFFEGKEMHREGRFIDFDRFENQLSKIYESIHQ
ncbi:thioredoxin family protein [Staphylococcus canis]|uniref:Thioredoxin family protein n=1 Tax=Staphylococcus canis TaxID=2724942 RepID=A0ABS0T6D0_9STAP|nr:thioredoxin family protein [Staphylococcus canis]MBI5974298.1 thioredoxin family protein [Staphylococcus canis]